MKNFVKVLHKNGAAFQHLSTMFPGLSTAKHKEDIFVGPEIREVLKDIDFEELLNLKELRAWEAFKSVCCGFLGNTRVPDYQACIEKLLKFYEDIGCRMSLKFHFLHSHLNFFPPNVGAVSNEHGERFHQVITKMERQMEPRHDGRLLLDALACHPGGKINQIFWENTLLTVCGTMNCVIVSSKYIDSISVLLSILFYLL